MSTLEQDAWLKNVLDIDPASDTAEAKADAPDPSMQGTGKLELVGSSVPTSASHDDAGGAPGKAAPGGGEDKTLEVVDRVIEIGEKVVTALVSNSGITNSSNGLTIIPAGKKPNQILDGNTGNIEYKWSFVNLAGFTTADIRFSLNYMFCNVEGARGKFLKDVRLIVSGSSMLGVSVKLTTTFGSPGNASGSANNWVVDLLVDIDLEWNSGYLSRGHEAVKLRLNAERGAFQA